MVDASILIVAVNGNGVMSGKILSIAEGKLDVKADATPGSCGRRFCDSGNHNES